MINETEVLILVNKFIYESGENLKNHVTGKVALIAATRRRKMLDAAENIAGLFDIPIFKCDYLDTENIEDHFDYPGFKAIEEIKADTIIVIANSTFLGGLRGYLDAVHKISYNHLVTSGQSALMIDRRNGENKFLHIK